MLFPVAPQALAKYRQTFAPSRAKDDPVDASLLIDLVVRHADHFQPWQPDRAEIRALQSRVQMRRTFVADRLRVTNRLIASLKHYYPQVLDWFEHRDTLVFCLFVEKWPTLQAVQAAKPEQVRRFFLNHNVRRSAVIERRIEAIQSAQPLITDPAIIEPNRDFVLALVHQLALLIGQIKQQERDIERLFKSLKDAALFESLPGAGESVTKSFWAKAFYQQQKAKGKNHHTILRSLAYKWIRILWRCWQDHKPYDEAKYLLALKAKGSPLVEQFVK